MSDRLEEALADVLARIEAGEDFSPDGLRAAYPDCWEEMRDVFEIHGRAADIGRAGTAGATARPGEAAKLRVVDADRYERFRVLGEGGMGTVYWALDTELNREVAFKIVRSAGSSAGSGAPAEPIHDAAPPSGTPASQAFETLKARFLQEAWVTAGLEHPGIVPVYEVGQTPEGVPFYTMRFVRGSRTLTQAIAETKSRAVEDRLALLDPFLRICDTMRYAHAHGVIHRDLKPDNVGLGEFGEVVVLDWGIAKIRDRTDAAAETWMRRLGEFRDATDLRTQVGALGTPGYMSPEAATGRIDDVDERSDVYSLGAILFQMLTGRLPYEFRTFGELLHAMNDGAPPAPAAVDASVPAALSAICLRALARGRDERQQSVDALATEVRAWIAKRARDHEIDVLEREAIVAMAAMADLQGDALLKQLDRVHAAATKLLDRAPENRTARGLLHEAERRRELGIRQRERATRRRTLRRAVFVGLAASLVAAVSVAWAINGQVRQTELARDAARDAVGEKDVALRGARASGLLNASAAAERSDPMLALLLAHAACREEMTARSLTQLHTAIFRSPKRVEMRGHTDEVFCAHFAPAGDRVLTASRDRTARIWTVEGRELAVLRGHEGAVTSAVWSPAGDRILTASSDGTARLWDAQGKELAVLKGHTGPVVSATFDAAGRAILTASVDRTARLWDSDGKPVAVLEGHTGPLKGAVFSPSGERLLTFGDDASPRLWDARGALVAVLTGHGGSVDAATFSRTGDRIVTASRDATARVWDVTGAAEPAVLRGHTSWVVAVAISADGGRVLTGSMDDTACLWSSDAHELRRIPEHQSAVSAVAFSPAGDGFATAADDGSVRVWDGAGRPLATIRGHASRILCLEYSPSGRTILTTSRDTTACISSVFAEEVTSCRGHTDALTSAFYSDAGDALLTASLDGTVRLWHTDGTPAAPPLDHGGAVLDATLSPSGDRIATAAMDGSAVLWDRAGKRIATLLEPSPNAYVTQVRFSQRTEFVIAAAATRSVRSWTHDGAELRRFDCDDRGDAISVDVSSDETRVVVGTGDGAILVFGSDGRRRVDVRPTSGHVWTAKFVPPTDRILVAGNDGVPRLLDANGQQISAFTGLAPGSCAATASRSGSLFGAVCVYDSAARLWLADGRPVATLRHDGPPTDIAFAAGGDLVVTASRDGTARLWTIDGHPVATLAGHDGQVRSAQFSPDGIHVITGGADKTAQVWLTRAADVVELAERRTVRDFTQAEREEFADLLGPDNATALAAWRLLDARDPDAEPLADAVARVESDASIPPAVRSAFARIAGAQSDSPDKLAQVAWRLVRVPGAVAADAARALHFAEAAARLAPGDGVVARVLGAAQFRAGRFDDALATLRFSDSQGRKCRPAGRPADEAFLAMTLSRLGRTDEARLQIAALELSIADTTWPASDDDRALAAEAEAMVAGR